MSCLSDLGVHKGLSRRRIQSTSRLNQAIARFAKSEVFAELPVSVFCAGSIARGEAGSNSDLDVFVISSKPIESRLLRYTVIAELIQTNKALDFPDFSNDGQYLKISSIGELMTLAGSPTDDSENLFTTRILMLLESEPLVNRSLFDEHLHAVLQNYYRDNRGKRSFRPLFLLNDLLRYWRTLCLNYEMRPA